MGKFRKYSQKKHQKKLQECENKNKNICVVSIKKKKSYRNTLNYTLIFFWSQNMSVKNFRKKLVRNFHVKKNPKNFNFFSTFKFLFFFVNIFVDLKKNIKVKIYEYYLFCFFIRQNGVKYVQN